VTICAGQLELDASSRGSSEMARNWIGLCPAVDYRGLMMMMITMCELCKFGRMLFRYQNFIDPTVRHSFYFNLISIFKQIKELDGPAVSTLGVRLRKLSNVFNGQS
jgi:hypothetical protein